MRAVDLRPDADVRLADSLLRIQVAAYRIEAAFIGDDRIPNLHETIDDLRSVPLIWLGVLDDSRLLGAIAYTETDTRLDIDRLFVEPGMHRRGVGRRLVQEACTRAGQRTTTVSTARGNAPARALYEGLGFRAVEDEEVLSDLWVTHFVRGPDPR